MVFMLSSCLIAGLALVDGLAGSATVPLAASMPRPQSRAAVAQMSGFEATDALFVGLGTALLAGTGLLLRSLVTTEPNGRPGVRWEIEEPSMDGSIQDRIRLARSSSAPAYRLVEATEATDDEAAEAAAATANASASANASANASASASASADPIPDTTPNTLPGTLPDPPGYRERFSGLPEGGFPAAPPLFAAAAARRDAQIRSQEEVRSRRELETALAVAVDAEDYTRAAAIKEELSALRPPAGTAGPPSRTAELRLALEAAVALEDYQAAAAIKAELEDMD